MIALICLQGIISNKFLPICLLFLLIVYMCLFFSQERYLMPLNNFCKFEIL